MKRRPLPYYESSLHSKPFALVALALIITIAIIPAFASPTLPLFSVTGISPVITPPESVGITLDTYALTAGQTATVTFTFPAPPAIFTLSDIVAPNGTVSNLAVTSDPTIYTAIYHPNSGVTDLTNAISLTPMVVMQTYSLGAGNRPTAIAFDGANMWTSNALSNGVSKIPLSGAPIQTWARVTGDDPSDIAFDGTNMWTANYTNASVTKIAPDGTGVTSASTAQPGASAIAFDGTNMWVANQFNNTVSKRDMTTGDTIGTPVDLNAGRGPQPNPSAIAFDGTNMWTADLTINGVTKIPISGAPTTTWAGITGLSPAGIVFDGTYMWTADASANSITRIASDGSATTFTGIQMSGSIGSGLTSLAFDGDHLWAANGRDNTVAEINDLSGTPGSLVGVYPMPAGIAASGVRPGAIAFDGTNMWTANNSDNSVTKISFTAASSSSNYTVETSTDISIVLDNYALSLGDTAQVTFTFPSPPVSFTLADVSASNGTLSGLAATADPKIYTATFTPLPGIVASSNEITVNGSISAGLFSGVGNDPRAIAFDGRNMWTTNYGDDSVTKIAPNGSSLNYRGTGVQPNAIAFDGTNMWTADNGDASVTKIAPTGNMTIFSGTGANPTAIAFDGTNMWTADNLGNSVTKIAPDGRMTTYRGIGANPRAIAFDGTNMWTVNTGDNSISKIAPDGTATNYSGIGINPHAIAFDGTNMWVASVGDSTVSKVAPDGRITTYMTASGTPAAIAFDGTNMWTANPGSSSISEILPDGTITTFGGLPADPSSIAFDGTNFWTANGSDGSATKILPTPASVSDNYTIDTLVSGSSSSGGSSGIGGGTTGGGGRSHGGGLDGPALMEIIPVPSPTTNPTPTYTFSSTESGTLAYGGNCTSTTTFVGSGLTMIRFSPLENGMHASCTILETDGSGRPSNVLRISPFVVDGPIPVVPVVPKQPVTPVTQPPKQSPPPVAPVSPVVPVETPAVVPPTSSAPSAPASPTNAVAVPTAPEVVPTQSVSAASNACPFATGSSIFGMIGNEISWRYCMLKIPLEAAFSGLSGGYMAKDGDFFAKLLAFIGVVGAGLMIFASGLFRDPLGPSDLILMPGRLWQIILESLGLKKRSMAWGTVYDSVTKAPLDPVRLELRSADGKTVATTTSRLDGTFSFTVPTPGNYSIVVRKDAYVFPSAQLGTLPHDEVYSHLYRGEMFTVAEAHKALALNIPLDPHNFEWRTYTTTKGGLMKAYALGDRLISHTGSVLLFFGLISSALALFMSPDVYALAVFGMALLIALMRPNTLAAGHFGYIRDADTGIPLSFAIVRIEASDGSPIVDVVTSGTGKYSYRLPHGRYLLKVDKKLPDGTYRTVEKDIPVHTRGGYIRTNISIKERSLMYLASMLPKA